MQYETIAYLFHSFSFKNHFDIPLYCILQSSSNEQIDININNVIYK
jgi:hypothetical protein